eukprot:scpid4052/ scgid3820/ Cation-independent mannose-6-phosphate receptor; 300 kDa mannose 6-phosphate receptor; Insulin-like growth factor 2 receptor; Insulin-like growth factor II receptor; M6P/IGF2 receptor
MLLVRLALLLLVQALRVAHADCPAPWVKNLEGVWQASYRSSADQEVANVFNISLCAALPEEEGCKDAAVCERLLGGKDVRRVGRWKTDVDVEATSNVTSNWEYRMSYKADCAARPDSDGVVTIEFWCGTTLGAPEVVFSDAMQCRHTIIWRTWAACHTSTVQRRQQYRERPCYALDQKGGLIDLSRLVHFNGATMVTLGDTLYFYDMCRRISRDPNSKQIPKACDKSTLCSAPVSDPMNGTPLAVNSSSLMYDANNNAVYVKFSGGPTAKCPKGFNASVHLTCPSKEGAERGVSMTADGDCVMELSWITQHACPRETHISESCVMKQSGHTYDLRPLVSAAKDTGYVLATGTGPNLKFQLNPCKAFTSASGCDDVTACQVDNGKAHAMGRSFDRQLHLVDGEFAMTLEHGQRCSSHLQRTTVIQFQCNRTVGYGQPHYVREDDCVYIFDWANNITCTSLDAAPASTSSPSSSSADSSVADHMEKGGEAAVEQGEALCQTSQLVNGKRLQYNLSPLTNDETNWQVVTGKGERAYTYFINVCRAVVSTGRAVNCSSSAASCQIRTHDFGSQPAAFSTGKFVSAPSVEGGMVTLRYRHGTKCHHAGERETIIRFVCAPGVTTSSPVFEDELDNCTYAFQWHTAYACPESAQTSDSCQLTDSHSGYTFDVANLGMASTVIGSGSSTNLTVAACGESVKSVCKSDGSVCAFPKDKSDSVAVKADMSSSLQFKHGRLTSIYTKDDTACSSKKRHVTVEYRCPPRPDHFQKETKENLPVDGTIHVDPDSVRDNDCNMIVHWYTNNVCVVSPEQCVVRDKSGQIQYDLSALSVANINESNWKAESTNGSQLFLINICRPLMAVHGCHPHSAVCSVRPAKSTTRPTDRRHYGSIINPNLGLGAPSTTSLKIIFAGEVQITYMSAPPKEGSMATPPKGVCKTVINLHCKKGVTFGHPVFVEKLAGSCSYVFDWETSKACKLTEETSGQTKPDVTTGGDSSGKPSVGTCRVSDESGFEFNMFGLHNHTDDYLLADPNNKKVKLRLNVCASLNKPCGDDKSAAACITKEDGTQVTAGVTNRTLRYFDGTVRLEYLNGAECSTKGDDGKPLKGKTIIEFNCDRTTHISKPVVISSKDSCEFIVSWSTSLACPQQAVPCRVEFNGSLYDLSPLQLAKGYWDAVVPADSTYRYMINVCGAVDDFKLLNNSGNCSNGHTSICQVGKPAHAGASGVYNAGSSQSSPIALKDGLLELRLSNGDQCYHHHQRVRTTIIQFQCDPMHTGAPEFQAETDCEYHFIWRTRYACALRNKKGHDCTVQDPYFTQHRYDLTPLAKLGPQKFTYSNESTKDTYEFLLSVCSPLTSEKSCGDAADKKTAACQLKDGKVLASAGVANGGLQYVDGNLELLYWQSKVDLKQRKCHGKYVRSTRIIFMCDREDGKGVRGSGPVMREEMSDCQYVVEWYTKLACNPSFHEAPCTVSGADGQVYDLSPLSLNRGAWQASNKLSDRRYYLSVCGELNTGYAGKDKPCYFSAAVCAVNSKQTNSYGQVHKLTVEKSAVVARYSDGSDCTDPITKKASHYNTLIRFSCRQGSKGTPSLVEESGCQSVFEWASDAACGTRNIPKPPMIGPPAHDGDGGGDATGPQPAVPTTKPLVLPSCVVESGKKHTVFDLQALMGKVYTLQDKSGMSYNLSVCGVLPEGSCPDKHGSSHVSVCQQTNRNGGKDWVNAGSDGGKLSYENGMVRLVIGDGTICHHNNQPRRTVVQFYCDHSKPTDAAFPHGKPSFDREEDCVYTFFWATPLACEKELKCSISDKKSGEVFDLSGLAKFNDNWKATSKTTSGTYLINVCRALTPLSSNKCPFSASSCLIDGDKHLSLGHINSGSLTQTADGTVLLSYTGGSSGKDQCPGGRTTNISFHCGDEHPGPVLTSVEGGCNYRFQWITPLVCTADELKHEEDKNTVVNAKKCVVTDGVSGDSFDLSRLYDGDRSHIVKGSKRTYHLNPCGAGVKDSDGCDNADVCAKASGDGSAHSTADLASRTVSYQYRTNTLNVSSTGGKCVGDTKWKTTILFVCSKSAGQGEPMLLSDNDCKLLFHWPTKFACGNIASECLLKSSAKNTIDLTPLERRHGAWRIKASNGDSFWLNLCAPVHEHVDGCSSDAAVCWKTAGSRTATSIGASSIRRLHPSKDHKAAVVEYFSHELCKKDPSRTYQVKIVVSCDPKKTSSQPVFKSADDCVFRFDWLSVAACPLGAKSNVQQRNSRCGYKDSLNNFVDLSKMLNHHRLLHTTEGTFHLQLCADESQRHHCDADAAACRGEEGAVETIASTGPTSRVWISSADGALLEVKSSHPCAADKTRNHSILVNFQCDSITSVEFDHSSHHCHYVFLWKTPDVCPHLPTEPILVTTEAAADGGAGGHIHQRPGGNGGDTDGNTGLGDGKATHKKKSSGAKTFGVVMLVTLILVLLVIAVVIYRSDNRLAMANRIFCFWRGTPRSPSTTRSYKQVALSEEQRDLLNTGDDDDNDMLVGGDDDEQLLAL